MPRVIPLHSFAHALAPFSFASLKSFPLVPQLCCFPFHLIQPILDFRFGFSLAKRLAHAMPSLPVVRRKALMSVCDPPWARHELSSCWLVGRSGGPGGKVGAGGVMEDHSRDWLLTNMRDVHVLPLSVVALVTTGKSQPSGRCQAQDVSQASLIPWASLGSLPGWPLLPTPSCPLWQPRAPRRPVQSELCKPQ